MSWVSRPGRGIIPARAGFTRPALGRAPCPADHPRSRGVYRSMSLSMSPTGGSSPLARGLPLRKASRDRRERIIPARAGFTPRGGPGVARRRDHPRSRGVYSPTASPGATRPGSSPLARGLQRPTVRVTPSKGIIPARAGFTPDQPRLRFATRDHPRSRGVYFTSGCEEDSVHGSSPLARGLPGLGVVDRSLDRIIPARAGFTRCPILRRTRGQDHPRSRGVYGTGGAPTGEPPGSSPLARGLRRGRGYRPVR